MRRIEVAPRAEHDLRDIWWQIADDSEEKANYVLEQLYHGFVKVAETPGIGHLRFDIPDNSLRV